MMVVSVLLATFLFSAQLNVGFIYIGPAGDAGWTYAHDQGRLHLEKVFGDQISTTFVESVPEGMEAMMTIESLARRGYDIIFTTSFGYMDPTFLAAEKYPNVWFHHCSGYKSAENMSTYFGRMYEPRFLTGLIAGMKTSSNRIGYVAAHPIPEVVRGINAFALGVRMVNPDARVHVVWSNTWYDPAMEKEAALSLLDMGCDVIAMHQDSPAPQQAAQERGAFSIGYNSDMVAFAPNAYLTSPVWNWGIYYERVIRETMAGTYQAEEYWGGMNDGIVGLAPMTDLVPQNARVMVEVFKEAIKAGSFHPFQGPVYNQRNELVIPKGQIPSDGELLSMSWFVDNVVGIIPGSN